MPCGVASDDVPVTVITVSLIVPTVETLIALLSSAFQAVVVSPVVKLGEQAAAPGGLSSAATSDDEPSAVIAVFVGTIVGGMRSDTPDGRRVLACEGVFGEGIDGGVLGKVEDAVDGFQGDTSVGPSIFLNNWHKVKREGDIIKMRTQRNSMLATI